MALEAYKAGKYDFREENNSKMWASMYSGKTFDKNLTVREEIPHELPRGMQAFSFNLRKHYLKTVKFVKQSATLSILSGATKTCFRAQIQANRQFF
ncbi:MAG: hypothetical protein Ct9H300mP28_15410 [Pseudomonadota bacterium]|nr:MAG: hypothetical protein Ct9H300mP28_15410 [Pseudomonadota bacterium]